MFDRAKAEALSRHVVAVIEHTDCPGVMTVVFDKAARADWMAFDVRHFPDVMVGNEWYQTAGSIGKKALGFDISVHSEDMKRATQARTDPTLHLDHAPANLYQFFMEKVRAGSVAHFAFAAGDAVARQAAHDAIDGRCAGEAGAAVTLNKASTCKINRPCIVDKCTERQARVLIIDDSAWQLQKYRTELEKRGYSVQSLLNVDAGEKDIDLKGATGTFSTLQQLDEAISLFEPDVVLSDYYMVNTDGAEVARHISNTRTVPRVIVHTSILDRENVDHHSRSVVSSSALDSGAVAVLAKEADSGKAESARANTLRGVLSDMGITHTKPASEWVRRTTAEMLKEVHEHTGKGR